MTDVETVQVVSPSPQGLIIQDHDSEGVFDSGGWIRQVLLAHSSTATTKIYTHPNFELAAEYVNRLPELLGKLTSKNVTKT